MEATGMFEKRYEWSPRVFVNTILFVFLIPSATFARAGEEIVLPMLVSGRHEYAAGNYKEAEIQLRMSVAEAGSGGVSDNELVLSLADLSNVLLVEGKADESEAFLNRAIAIVRSRPTVDRRQLPVLLGLLGTLYQQTGRMEQTEAVLSEAMRLGRRLLVDEPLHLSDIHNDLGVLHLQAGKRKQAEDDFKTALSLVEKAGQDSEARKSSILANLSALYFGQEKWNLAEQTLLRAVEIVERTQGSEHPNICALLDNLGFLYFKQNDLARAESVLRRELAIRRTVFGQENASTASAGATLASVLAARGQYIEAGNLFAEVLTTQERVLGRVPEVATTLDQFADLLRRTHRDDLAEEMTSRAQSIRFESAYTVSIKAQRGP
jgi:tetratricopeptide (TPR) repeat protein